MAWNNDSKVSFTEIQVIAEVPLWQTERSTGIIQVAIGSWDSDEGSGKVGIDVRKWVYTDAKGWKAQGGLFISDEAAVTPTADALADAFTQLQKMAAKERAPRKTAAATKTVGGVRRRQPSATAPRRRTTK